MKHRQLLVGFVQVHVLYHAAQAPVCGSELAEELSEHGYRISPGTLYPMLQRLEKRGYLKSSSTQQGKEFRRYYTATKLGREALAEAQTKVQELFHELLELKQG